MIMQSLTPQQRDTLENYFDSEENMGLITANGFLLAISVGPVTPASTWIPWLLEGQKPADNADFLNSSLLAWQHELAGLCYHDDALILPCNLDPEDPSLTDWCDGFMEAVFCQEERWYAQEAMVAELTMPMVLFSSLDDSPEPQAVRKNRKLAQQMAEHIPDLLKELYLVFQSDHKSNS